eukprot:6202022-Amphidinium_carterae.1
MSAEIWQQFAKAQINLHSSKLECNKTHTTTNLGRSAADMSPSVSVAQLFHVHFACVSARHFNGVIRVTLEHLMTSRELLLLSLNRAFCVCCKVGNVRRLEGLH